MVKQDPFVPGVEPSKNLLPKPGIQTLFGDVNKLKPKFKVLLLSNDSYRSHLWVLGLTTSPHLTQQIVVKFQAASKSVAALRMAPSSCASVRRPLNNSANLQ